MKARMLVLLATVAGAFILGGGVVFAAGFSPTILAMGTIAKSTHISANGIEFSSRKNTQVFVQQGDFVGGGTTGWHTHPGLTVVTVTSGKITYHSRCQTTVYKAGDSFVELPNTPVKADATETAQVITTLIVPAGMARTTPLTTAPDCTNSNNDD